MNKNFLPQDINSNRILEKVLDKENNMKNQNSSSISSKENHVDIYSIPDIDSNLTLEEKLDRESVIRDQIPASVSYRVIDMDVYALVRRMKRGTIVIPNFQPDKTSSYSNNEDSDIENFQRNFVWKKNQQDKFLETLLLRYPIPGIILIETSDKDQQSDKWLVLDGQQRLTTLYRFLEENYRIGSGENNVLDKYKGKTHRGPHDALTEVEADQLENYTISATIIKVLPDSNDVDAIYQIFERINSGGTQLTSHEIRVAIYSGYLVGEIERLNSDTNWRELYGKDNDIRFRDHELISRILAMSLNWGSYKDPLKQFLNVFYREYRNANTDPSLKNTTEQFLKVTNFLKNNVGKRAFRRGDESRSLNVASIEAIYVALMLHASELENLSPDVANRYINDLVNNDEFISVIEGRTTNTDNAKKRIHIAIDALEGLLHG